MQESQSNDEFLNCLKIDKKLLDISTSAPLSGELA